MKREYVSSWFNPQWELELLVMVLEAAAAFTMDQILTIKLPFTFRILCCLTLDVWVLFYVSVEKCPLKGVCLSLRCLSKSRKLQLCPSPTAVISSRLCASPILILETAAHGYITSHEAPVPIKSVPFNKRWEKDKVCLSASFLFSVFGVVFNQFYSLAELDSSPYYAHIVHHFRAWAGKPRWPPDGKECCGEWGGTIFLEW